MRFGSRTLGAVVVVAAVATVAAPTAGSSDDESPPRARLVVRPADARPGEEVELRVWGCEGSAGTAASKAFVVDAALVPAAGGGGALYAEAKIRSAVASGAYGITVRCDGRDGHTGRDGDAGRDGDDGRDGRAGSDGSDGVAAGRVWVDAAGGRHDRGHSAGHGRGHSTGHDAVPRGGFGVAEAYGLALAGGTALTLGGLALYRRRGRSDRPAG